MSDYNGWTNYETWNVAFWIGNDKSLYSMAREHRNNLRPYQDFRDSLRELDVIETPDGVSYSDSGLDLDELDQMMEEL